MTAVRLNNNQLKQLAEFTSNLGLIFAGSVIAPLFSEIDKISIVSVSLGIVLMLFSLVSSLILLRSKKI